MMMAWIERGEVGEEVERPMAMELLDSELVYFSEDYKKFTSLESCSLITSGCSTCSAAAAITSSQSCTATPEEVSNYRRSSSSKKQRTGRSASLGTIKVRKDKLGDKILALQQLVSPFCKSDTASVLHEALGYIRFLHDQIQVLSSPYLLQRLPTATAACRLQGGVSEDQWSGGGGGGAVSDLRSRGLCLVSIACTTAEVTNDSGADFWCCACAATEYSTAQSTKN